MFLDSFVSEMTNEGQINSALTAGAARRPLTEEVEVELVRVVFEQLQNVVLGPHLGLQKADVFDLNSIVLLAHCRELWLSGFASSSRLNTQFYRRGQGQGRWAKLGAFLK